ncbi:hypothetical protein QR680_018678 [Steinernema hermaphroditum]|uniref:Uncharacterized protein n=1 Tax=Steinernema hermaphroditum TaxID=289476 RepID=A0AA39HIP1_9BILA|nr:hypothetical protein QR680_018678 [Steinernema hermaphroditum]
MNFRRVLTFSIFIAKLIASVPVGPAGAAAIASAVVSLIDTADSSPQHITVQGGDQKNVQGDQTLSNKISLPPININVVNINNFDASGENPPCRLSWPAR